MLAAAVVGPRYAAAATYAFTGDGTTSTSQSWNVATHWTPNGLPGPADTAEFDSTDDKNLAGATVDTGANQSVGVLLLGQSGRALSQSFTIANNTVTLGAAAAANAVTLSRTGVGVQTVASNVSLGSVSQTWTLANSNAATPGSVTVSGNITEVTPLSGISKQGAGTLQLNGANTFTGVYATRGGITVIGNGLALGVNATTLVSDPVTSSDASLLTANGVTFGRNVTVLSGSTHAATLGGNANQTASTWTGGTITLNQATNLTGGTAGTVTFAGPIVDGGGGTSPAGTAYSFVNSNVTKVDAGTVVLAAANTYSGTTTVAAGTLRVANAAGSGTGTGAVTVNGGTLAGTGSVAGNVVVSPGGTITAGTGGTAGDTTGVLTAAGTHTWAAGSTYTVKIDASNASSSVAVGSGGSGTAGTASDELVFGGLAPSSTGLAISPVFVAATAGSLANGQYSFVIADDKTGAANSTAARFDGLTLGTQITVPTSSAGTFGLSTASDGTAGGEELILDFNSTAATPEPTSLLLAGLAAAPLAAGRRRRRTSR